MAWWCKPRTFLIWMSIEGRKSNFSSGPSLTWLLRILHQLKCSTFKLCQEWACFEWWTKKSRLHKRRFLLRRFFVWSSFWHQEPRWDGNWSHVRPSSKLLLSNLNQNYHVFFDIFTERDFFVFVLVIDVLGHILNCLFVIIIRWLQPSKLPTYVPPWIDAYVFPC